MSAPTTRTAPPRIATPLFGGYALVACTAAWLAGIALRPLGPLVAFAPAMWLGLAVVALAVWLGGRILSRRAAAIATGDAPRPMRWLLVAGMLVFWLALGAARTAAADPTTDPHAISRYAAGQQARVQGIVDAEPDLRDGARLLTVATSAVSFDGGKTWQSATGDVEAFVAGPDDYYAPSYGDGVTLTGTLLPIGDTYAPAGVIARLTSVRATVISQGGGNPLLAALFDLRLRLAQIIQHALPEPEAALLIGILLGLKTPVLRARLPLFTATGTIHLVVPAGLKVATLAELASTAFRPLGRWPRTIASLGAVAIYAALGGGGPAALRAAIMGALLALAPALARGYNVFSALALATLAMTAIQPALIDDAGFQLTVLATMGLPLLVPPIQRRLARVLGRLPLGAVVAELLAVTLAAQIATLPVLALTFHEVSLVAPLANLLAVPLLAPVLVLGALLAGVGLLPAALGLALSLAIGWVLWPLLWFMDTAIAICANLPAAALAVPDLSALVAWAYYVALAGILAWLGPLLPRRAATRGVAPPAPQPPVSHLRLSRSVLVALLAVALFGALGAAAPAATDRAAHLDFLDVGAGGGAIFLRLPSGATALIDGGPSGSALEAALNPLVPFWRRSLDLALLRDPRPGDARGLEDAAAHFTLANAADTGMRQPSVEYLAWLDAAKRAGATHAQIRQGDALRLDATTTLNLLSPPQTLFPSGEGDTTASDDAILRLETPGLRALLLGAADDYALDALAYSGQSLTADIVELALPSGGALDLSGPLGAVLARTHAKLIVITSAPVAPGSLAARRAAADDWDTDANASSRLQASIVRVESSGTIDLSGGANGWSLG